MWLNLSNVCALLLLASSSLGGEENDWLTKSWSSFNPSGSSVATTDFDNAFNNFNVGFDGTPNAASSNKKNNVVFVNPFVSSFSAQSYPVKYVKSPNQFNKNSRPLKVLVKPQTSQRYTRPLYAPTYGHSNLKDQGQNYGVPNAQRKIIVPIQNSPNPQINYQQNQQLNRPLQRTLNPNGQYQHNQQFRIPPQNSPNHYGQYQQNQRLQSFPQYSVSQHGHNQPNQQLNRGHVNTKSLPQNKPFQPYKAANAYLGSYYNDPYYKHVKVAVDGNERRLKYKEEPKQLHNPDEESSQESSDEEGERKFNRNEEQENFTPEHEEYIPQNAPVYYQPTDKHPIDYNRIQNKLVYPRINNQNIKIHPHSYGPLKNHINTLKTNQGKTFTDENSNYPASKPTRDDHDEKEPDGHDIFDGQKSNFDSGKANFHGNFDGFVRNHHQDAPILKESPRDYSQDDRSSSDENDDFIPVKMYAQVRKTETVKHLPREAAAEDAETYDDFLNAPRLREAIKSSKAQTVYTEEGYEDNAYDHAGHLKHASNHQDHSGYLKGKEAAAGRYKDGSAYKYKDGGRNSHGQDISKGKKWHDDKGKEDEYENEESFENKEGAHESKTNDLDEAGTEKKGVKKISFAPKTSQKVKGNTNKLVMTADIEQTMVKDADDGGIMINTKSKHVSMNNDPSTANARPKYVRLRPNYYWKRPKKTNTSEEILNKTSLVSPKNKTELKSILKEKYAAVQRRVRRDSDFQIPLLNFNEAFLSNKDIKDISKEKLGAPLIDLRHIKYPYYNKHNIHKNSPLRYAESLRNIPQKTHRGSEFYDSRSNIHCDEVVSNIDPIPDRIKNKMPDSHMDDEDDEEKDDEEEGSHERKKRYIQIKVLKRQKRDNFKQNHEQPRLRGLGDKIDCFKEKYFGSNPLDSPFFDEEDIDEPEPIEMPSNIFTPIVKMASSYYPKTIYGKPKRLVLRPSTTPVTKLEPISASSTSIKSAPNKEIIVPTTYKPHLKIPKLKKTQKVSNLLTGETDKYVSKYNKNKFADNSALYGKSNKISLANVIFDKYTLSKDPQMRVYGDIIGNIKANLNSESDIAQTPAPATFTPSFIPIHYESISRNKDVKNIEKRTPIVVYEAFKNKEQVYNPNVHTRITRNNHFLYQPYKIIKGNHLYTKKPNPFLRPSAKKIKRPNIVAEASSYIPSMVDLNGQPVKRSANIKVYKDIGRKERQISDFTENYENVESDTQQENIPEETDSKGKQSLSSNTGGRFDERRGEPRYEDDDIVQHKNHKKYYSPVTAKTSITPEELNVEYLLKSTEDSDHILDELKNNNTSTTDSSQNVFVTENIKSEDKDETTNSTADLKDESKKTFNTPHRFQGYREASRRQIFDVSAFLPKIFVSGLPKHNFSSKYSASVQPKSEDYILAIPLNNINESSSDNADIDVTTKRYKNSESIRHTVEVHPSATIVPEVTITSRSSPTYVSTESIRLPKKNIERSSDIRSTTSRPYRQRTRQRVRLTTTTRSPTTKYSDEDDGEYYTTRTTPKIRTSSRKPRRQQTTPRYIPTTTTEPTTTEEVTEYDNKHITEQEEPSYNYEISNNEDEIKTITETPDEEISNWTSALEYQTPITTSTTTEKYYERTTRPRRIKRPLVRSRAQFDKIQDHESLDKHQEVPQKPRILEKTSKKRKTTVITNSKHYENNGNAVKKPRRKSKSNRKNNTTPRISSDEEDRIPIEKQSDDEQLEIKETGRVVQPKEKFNDDRDSESSEEYNSDEKEDNEKRSEKLRQTPINEESRFEEDVEEEEVIQERQTPSDYSKKDFGFYHDPDLAKEVNRLTDSKKEDQHPVHSDVEVFRADFKTNRGPKHGGNYKKIPTVKKSRKRLDEAGELDDLNVGSELTEESLHGGNYRTAREEGSETVEDKGISARVLNSFAALLPIISSTEKPLFEKDPGKRLYFFAKI